MAGSMCTEQIQQHWCSRTWKQVSRMVKQLLLGVAAGGELQQGGSMSTQHIHQRWTSSKLQTVSCMVEQSLKRCGSRR